MRISWYLRPTALAAATALLFGTTVVFAQSAYPAKPLRLILPFPPGGPTDLLGRSIAEKLGEALAQPVVVENRPGAGGNVGAEAAARSVPDGYTIVLCAPSLAISPSLYRKMNYDPLRDLAPIARVATIPNVLLVHPSVAADSLRALIELAKSRPGKLNYGSGGAGTSNHLAGELLKLLAGIEIVHVPYKGVETAMKAMLGGEIELVVIGVPPTIAHIRAGRLRPLAVLSSRRVRALPEVPTAAEAGLAELEVETWYGVLAPTGTPSGVLSRLNRELVAMMNAQDMRDRLGAMGIESAASTPESFGEFLSAETLRWAKVVKASGARVD